MSDDGATRPPGLSSPQLFKLVVGIVVFGVLTGIRTEFEQVWVRALVAACAGGILAWAFLQTRRSKS